MTIQELNMSHWRSFDSAAWSDLYDHASHLSAEFLNENLDGGKMRKINPIALPLFIPDHQFRELVSDAEGILAIQKKILNFIQKKYSNSEILAMFDLPPQAEKYVRFDAIAEAQDIGRFDLIWDENDHPYFCELNMDSSVGCGEIISFYDILQKQCNSLFADGYRFQSFYADLSQYLAKKALLHGKKSVVIADWSSWADNGIFNYKLLTNSIEKAGLSSVVLTEKCSSEELAKLDSQLIYRIFMYDDIDNEQFTNALFESDATIVSGFECNILSNKIWFALFYSSEFASLLSDYDRKLVNKVIPFTEIVSENSIASLLDRKNELIFKPVNGFGGRSILVGQDHSKMQIEEVLSKRTENWIAQKYIRNSVMPIPIDNHKTIVPHNVVYGLYKAGDSYSGLLIRASQKNKVVNVSAGGSLVGWAFPVAVVNIH